MTALAFVVGLSLGASVGVVVAALLFAARNNWGAKE